MKELDATKLIPLTKAEAEAVVGGVLVRAGTSGGWDPANGGYGNDLPGRDLPGRHVTGLAG
jgi:hypothetical protein